MDDKALVEILKYTGVAIAAAIAYLFKKFPLKRYWKSLKSRRSLDKWREAVEDLRLIGLEHSKLFLNHNISRNCFFIAHNCGNIPTKEKKFYTCVKDAVGVDADGSDLRIHIDEEYGEKILVDFKTTVLLEDARTKGAIHFFTKDMKDGVLKSVYINDKVAETILCFYYFDDDTKTFSFSSHSRYENEAPFTESQIHAAQFSANVVRTKFSE